MKIVVTSHADLCHSLLKSYQMIVGSDQKLLSVELNEKGIGDFQMRLKSQLDELRLCNEKILILCDIYGGTPFNESYQYLLMYPSQVFIVSGVNLPMLIEVALIDDLEPQEMINRAIEAGTLGIKTVDIKKDDDSDIEF